MARLQMMFNVLEAAHREDMKLVQRENREERSRESYVHLREDTFVAVYRLNRELFDLLSSEVAPLLGYTRRGDITPERKILTALSFYASGSYQSKLGVNVHSSMSQQSVSRAIRQVTEAINSPNILHKYIRFPQTRPEREEIKQGFHTKFGFPEVVSCIDCTRVALIRPTQNEERYFNRKYYNSLNVQVMSDSNLKILSVDASYGGATHDSLIWNRHPVKPHLESLSQAGERSWLLGDSGYAQSAVMMTPMETALPGSVENNYNELHKTTHKSVERTIGVLKGRWRCLLAAKELHYDPATAGKIVNACCVLHNMCVDFRLEAPRLTPHEAAVERDLQEPSPAESNLVVPMETDSDLNIGRETRAQLALELWRARL